MSYFGPIFERNLNETSRGQKPPEGFCYRGRPSNPARPETARRKTGAARNRPKKSAARNRPKTSR